MAFGDNGSPLEMLTLGNKNPCWNLEKIIEWEVYKNLELEIGIGKNLGLKK